MKKYQIFVSSTFTDLKEERADAIRNILELDHLPAGMELFPAADMNQIEYIKKVIDECDYYVLIIGGRYGSIDRDGISYTEKEYDYAVQTGKVVLAFIHDSPEDLPLKHNEKDKSKRELLEAFKEKVSRGRLVKFWRTRTDLDSLVMKALVHAFKAMPQTGWIRDDHIAKNELIEKNNEFLQENIRLKGIIESFEKNQDELDHIEEKLSKEDRFWMITKGGAKPKRSEGFISPKEIFSNLVSEIEKNATFEALKSAIEFAFLFSEYDGNPDPMPLYISRMKYKFIYYGLVDEVLDDSGKGWLKLTTKGMGYYAEKC